MQDLSKQQRNYRRGDKVWYIPYEHAPKALWEKGTVKRMSEDGKHAFVLYDTSILQFTERDLDNYTCARTEVYRLRLREE